MSRRPVVVDGSNLATEGRSMPSLAQLDEAVRAWLAENPDDEVIVVVDASFSYRIDESERRTFEEAEDAGEVVCPPAGAVGRGDGFLLRIADRVDAAVLSNDSFQEFHGEYKWLFDSGRLLGGKPVPNVGWIFTPRTPVRGPKSRMAVRDAQRATRTSRSAPVVKAIAQATAEAIEVPQPTDERRGRRRSGRAAETAPVTTHEAVNEPLPFVTFIAEHPLGTGVEGTVVSFTSHGAFVDADGARCYVPVVGLGDPPPRTAKAVLKAGEVRTFVVQALDPPRRGIELALPEVARVAGAPTEETVEAEIGARRPAPQRSVAGIPPPPRGRRSPAAVTPAAVTPAAVTPAAVTPADEVDAMAPVAPVEAVGDSAVRSPRRSPRRRGSAPTGNEVQVDTHEEATASPEAPPARRSRRTLPAEPVAPVGPLEEVAEAAPSRRRRAPAVSTSEPAAEPASTAGPRSRRSTKQAAPVLAPEVASAPSADHTTLPEADAPPRRSRRTAKKVSPVASEPLSPVDTGELLAVTTDKAAARVPRTRKRAPEAAGPGTAEGASTPKATKATKAAGASKGRVAKRTAEPVPATAADAKSPVATPRRRAPAKKAAAASALPAKATKSAAKAPAAKSRAKKAAATRPSDDGSPAAKRATRRST